MSIRARKNVGVIGLGIIGQRVADNLRERGFHVFVWSRTPRPVPNFVGSPSEVVELCDVIQLFVSDDEALLQLVQRISRDLSPNHIIVAHCTVSPDTMRTAAEIAGRRGAQLVDAPFTGSKMAAEKGQLVYYVGGDEVALQRVRPILEASSKEIIEIGKVGDATTIKVATNMVTATTVQGAAEALALVAKSGLSVEKFVEAMRSNGSYSPTLDMKLPMMTAGNFETHFSTKHMLKDVVIATRLARTLGIEVGATDASRRGLAEEVQYGRGDDDYSSLFRQYFPDGLPRKGDQEISSSEEDQPRFAGLDEAITTAGPKPPEEVTAALPEAKQLDEVVAALPEPKQLDKVTAPAEPKQLDKVTVAPAEAKQLDKVTAAPAEAKQLDKVTAAPPDLPVTTEVIGAARPVVPISPQETKENGSLPAETRALAIAADKTPPPSGTSEPQVESIPPAAPDDAEKSAEPAGMWGGFWRRTDGN